MGSFNVEKMRKEVKEINEKNEKNERSSRGLSTLLQFYQGKPVKIMFSDGEIMKGTMQRYSLYEIELRNKHGTFIVWKQNIKYMRIENE